MKKLLFAVLLLAFFLICGCGGENTTPATEAPTVPQKADSAPVRTTVMVYMVGSDLEARAGAATRDMAEMADSGVDPSLVNVVVYAGGAPYWQEAQTQPEVHTLLELTADGFSGVTSTPAVSMGTSQCLSNFLNYAYDHYPAERYALILWDHGNGPVIGYGKDMLFDNDSLTLQEMTEALAATPFREEKLAFIGFDACLMASGELACAMAPYGEYLVASQEVEPAFGWDYSFLAGVAEPDLEKMLQKLTEDYLDTCQAYYREKGYENKDITLSCLELSYGPALQDALNGLFFRACPDMEANYHQFVTRRVNTRALGRATTGAEYDLIDLADMARRLSDLYPAEAEAVLAVLADMVVANATNTVDCCGLSLYYPFYNKDHYTMSWGQTYDSLGIFESYGAYLDSYRDIWLGEDQLALAASDTPDKQDENTYTLRLTPEQEEVFASARYYILVRDGSEYYTRVFTSGDVTLDDGLLTANFDGNVLYATSGQGDCHIPVAVEHDPVGDNRRYSVVAALSNYTMDYAREFMEDTFEKKVAGYRFSLGLDKKTGQVTVSSILPVNAEGGSDGKAEEGELSQWVTCTFVHDAHRYLSRYENGAVCPVDAWPADTVFTGYEMNLAGGLEFVYAPLVSGEYYLLFEIEDTQGNRYCSEPLPIRTEGKLPEKAEKAPVEKVWTEGEKCLLAEENGLQIYLTRTLFLDNEYYNLQVVNENPFPVMVAGENLMCNDTLLCTEDLFYFGVAGNTTGQDDIGSDLNALSDAALPVEIENIQFSLTVSNAETAECLLFAQPFRITLGQQTLLRPNETSILYNGYQSPACGLLAPAQTLYSSKDVMVRLIGMGGNGITGDLRALLYMENRSQEPVILEAGGLALDDIYVPLSGRRVTLPGGCGTYQLVTATNYQLQRIGITQAGEAKLLLQQWEYSPLFSGNTQSELNWCPVALKQKGSPASLDTRGQVLLEAQGVTVTLLSAEAGSYRNTWQLAVVNDTDAAISLDIIDRRADGAAMDRGLLISDTQVGPGQKTVCELSFYPSEAAVSEVSFTFRVMDFKGEAITFVAAEPVTLTIEE